jgi:hypothetical protein
MQTFSSFLITLILIASTGLSNAKQLAFDNNDLPLLGNSDQQYLTKQQAEKIGNSFYQSAMLSNILIDDVEIINHNGNILTKELIDTTAKLQKQFNDNQTKVLEKYQLEIDTHLEKTMGGISDIAKGMLEVVELIHQTKEESEK